jgi:transcriptional regulator with XRE-family HTH domain/quercetin dioxygenase-like cupin family protein
MRVSQLARLTGVSSSMISQIERGHSRPSVGTLFAIARVLEVPVDTFFAEASEQPEDGAAPSAGLDAPPAGNGDGVPAVPEPRTVGAPAPGAWQGLQPHRDVVRRDQRASLDIRGGVRWERLTATALDGVEFLELVYAPGAESDGQAYRHPGVELVLVTHGVMTIFLGFEQHDLEPGDSIAFASSTPHRYVNLTSAETRATTVILRDDLSTLEFRDSQDGAATTE